MNSTRRRPAAGLLVVLVLLLLALVTVSCSSDDAGGAAGDSAVGYAEERPERPTDGQGPADGGGEEPAGDGATSEGEPGEDQAAGPRGRTLPQTRAVISKGSVSLESEDVTAARFDVLAVVDAHDGEVTDEETATDDEGELSYARMVVRVPSARFAAAMADLAGVATLESTTRSSEDVTTQVIDTEARVRAQERSLRRIEALLAEAEDLQQVIAIESQLAQRQAELDSLKQQLAWLADQTSMSRIAVHLDRVGEDEPDDDEQPGFLVGLSDGWAALITFATGVSRVVGVVLPFAGLLLLLVVPVWLAVRSARRHRGLAVAGAGTPGEGTAGADADGPADQDR